jgi:PERQ amino acid-rich with GYF domain-containing protein
MSGWNQDLVNGGAPRAWGKSNDNHVPQEPGACWDENGFTGPMGLLSLTADEKEVRIHMPRSAPTLMLTSQ